MPGYGADKRLIDTGHAASALDGFLIQVIVHKFRILLENGILDEALRPGIINILFDANISLPCVHVH